MEIGGHILIQEVQDIISSKTKISLSQEAIERTQKCLITFRIKLKGPKRPYTVSILVSVHCVTPLFQTMNLSCCKLTC